METTDHSTRILAIETSCDETAAAVIADGTTILSNVVASQTELHARYGGVFPEVASRRHVEVIYPVVEEAMRVAHLGFGDLDCVAVTRGPGLVGSLLVGVNMAKGLAVARNLPLLGINHIEGHIYSLWLTEDAPHIRFPVLTLVVSGGRGDGGNGRPHRRRRVGQPCATGGDAGAAGTAGACAAAGPMHRQRGHDWRGGPLPLHPRPARRARS